MTRSTFVEAMEGLREALERLTSRSYSSGHHGRAEFSQQCSMCQALTKERELARAALARWNDRQRLWDDEEIVRILTRLFLRGIRVPLAARDIDNHLAGGTAGTTAKKEG